MNIKQQSACSRLNKMELLRSSTSTNRCKFPSDTGEEGRAIAGHARAPNGSWVSRHNKRPSEFSHCWVALKADDQRVARQGSLAAKVNLAVEWIEALQLFPSKVACVGTSAESKVSISTQQESIYSQCFPHSFCGYFQARF